MDDGIDGETLHQPPELFRGEVAEFIRGPRPCEPSALDPLVEEEESVAFPYQAFDLGSGPSAEEEEGIGNEQALLIPAFDDRGEGIDPISQVGKSADEIDAGKRTGIGILKHSAPP